MCGQTGERMSAQNYSELKTSVESMIRERDRLSSSQPATPSPLWSNVLNMLQFALCFGEKEFRNIRFHTGLITGDIPYKYWHYYPPLNGELFAKELGYRFYTESIPEKYWISEPDFAGYPHPIGVTYKDKVINKNICRYQSCVSNLHFTGLLEDIRKTRGNLIVEIGGGYGGLTHGLFNILSGSAAHVIVDFPEMLLFSGGFLITNNPKARFYFYNPATFTEAFVKNKISEYDFVLLPNWCLPMLQKATLKLVINMMSFQEMTPPQIKEYSNLVTGQKNCILYSDNMDQHPHNPDLKQKSVSDILNDQLTLFPSVQFYDEHVPQSKEPWFYKCYLGYASKNGIPFNPHIRLVRWGNEYDIQSINNEWCVTHNQFERQMKLFV
jgi:hypothetical protein